MTWGGWISMTASLAVVIGLFGWCCYKLVTTSENSEDGEGEPAAGDESK